MMKMNSLWSLYKRTFHLNTLQSTDNTIKNPLQKQLKTDHTVTWFSCVQYSPLAHFFSWQQECDPLGTCLEISVIWKKNFSFLSYINFIYKKTSTLTSFRLIRNLQRHIHLLYEERNIRLVRFHIYIIYFILFIWRRFQRRHSSLNHRWDIGRWQCCWWTCFRSWYQKWFTSNGYF